MSAVNNLGPRTASAGGFKSDTVRKNSSFSALTNQWLSKVTLTPATAVTATSGFNCIRGELNLTAGKTLNGLSFAAGVYGRANIHGTVDIASGDLAAVYAKMDLSSAVITNGYVAPLQANIVNNPADSSKVNLIYAESAGPNKINSFLKGYAAATYAVDLQEQTPGTIVTATAGASASLNLRIKLNGTAYKIALLADA